MKSNEERINDLLSHLDSLTYIKPEEIQIGRAHV